MAKGSRQAMSPMDREEPIALAGGVVRPVAEPIAVKWPLLKVQRSAASQDEEWQVSGAAVIGPQNLTGCTQS